MDVMSKADRFIKGMTELGISDKKWLYGNETEDPLRFAFDAKRVIHPGVKGTALPKDRLAETWNMLVSSSEYKGKKLAYVHIPFCSTRCLYCGFFQNYTNRELEDAYIDRLIEDFKMSSRSPFIVSQPFHAVYIGGGTPPDMSVRNIKRLLLTINECLPLANDCEFTFEARIHNFDDEKVGACLKGGINRFSLGVQSFNTSVRRALGRREPRENVIERLRYIYSLGHAPVVIDLMYGLPMQTMDIWEDDVTTLIGCGIDGGDLYQLNVYSDSKLNDAIAKGNIPPAAKTSEQAVMFKKGVELMQAHRMKRLSICHWADGTRERNLYNSLSRSGAATVPFGSGAGGNIYGYTMFIDRDVKNYMQGIDRKEKPLMFIMSPPLGYELYYDIIRQMERGYIDLLRIKARYGVDMEEALSTIFNEWTRKGLVRIDGNYLDLTIAGQFWYVNLTQAILDSLVMLGDHNGYSITVKSIATQG